MPETFVVEFFPDKAPGSSRKFWSDRPPWPNFLKYKGRDSIKNVCTATTVSNHRISYIEDDEDSNVSSYRDMTLRFP